MRAAFINFQDHLPCGEFDGEDLVRKSVLRHCRRRPQKADGAAALPTAAFHSSAASPALNLVSLGIGDIIGAGIFVLTGHAAAANAGPAITLSFVLGALSAASPGCVTRSWPRRYRSPAAPTLMPMPSMGETRGLDRRLGSDARICARRRNGCDRLVWLCCELPYDLGITVPPAFARSPLDYDAAAARWHATGTSINVPAMVVSSP